eukprot:g25018.t1
MGLVQEREPVPGLHLWHIPATSQAAKTAAIGLLQRKRRAPYLVEDRVVTPFNSGPEYGVAYVHLHHGPDVGTLQLAAFNYPDSNLVKKRHRVEDG